MSGIARSLAIALLLVATSSGVASALPIQYVITADSANGSLGGVLFNDAAITITAIADTGSIETLPPTTSSGKRVINERLTLEVAGFAPAEFSNVTQTVSNQDLTKGGFGDLGRNRGILFVVDPSFGSYDLDTEFGPVSGLATISFGSSIATSAGNFTLTAVEGASFQATVIPEPGTLLLVAGGLCWLATRARGKG